MLAQSQMIRELDTGDQREIPIEEHVPPGWLPPTDAEGTHVDQPIGTPRFETPTQFSVPLLSG